MDLLETEFTVQVEDRSVPVALWEPAAPKGPVPLVLVGHGGNGHKKQDYVAAVARGLAKHHGIAAAAIDGPVHGDRRKDRDPKALAREFAEGAPLALGVNAPGEEFDSGNPDRAQFLPPRDGFTGFETAGPQPFGGRF